MIRFLMFHQLADFRGVRYVNLRLWLTFAKFSSVIRILVSDIAYKSPSRLVPSLEMFSSKLKECLGELGNIRGDRFNIFFGDVSHTLVLDQNMVEALMSTCPQPINAHSLHPLLPRSTFNVPTGHDGPILISSVTKDLPHLVLYVLVLSSASPNLLGDFITSSHDTHTLEKMLILRQPLKKRYQILFRGKHQKGNQWRNAPSARGGGV